MVNNTQSLIPFEFSYEFKSFIPARGDVKSVAISGKTASWENGLITVTENKISINPPIYSSFKDGNDRSQPLKKIDSSEYFPLATLTVTNKDAGDKLLHNIGGIGLDSIINLSIKGQNIELLPLKVNRPYIGLKDFREAQENNNNKDEFIFPRVLHPYQNLQIKNPKTGRPERSPFYFGYVGAVEGKPKSITKDQLLVGNKNTANHNDGETKTYTLYGRLFAVDIFDPINITSITEDTGVKGDFRTSDNTLIFNGTAEARSKVEVFINNSSIGTTNADALGKWSYDYTGFKFSDGQYGLTATETNLYGEVKSVNLTTRLEIDTNYDIDLDFSDPSVANNQKLQNQIKKAADYWEKIILKDIPDVKGVKGFIDDLKIKFIVEELKNKQGGKDGKEGTLAVTDNYYSGRKLSQNSIDPLTGQSLSSFNSLPSYAVIRIDSADLNEVAGTFRGLQTLQHEIAHAIGFNSYTFALKQLVKKFKAPDGSNRYGFTGKNALKAYKELGGETTHNSVPLEEKSDPGHWNEWLFPDSREETILGWFKYDELMTTSTPPGKDAILSKLTRGAFKDLGFTVDDAKAGNIDVFTGGFLGFVDNPLFNIPY